MIESIFAFFGLPIVLICLAVFFSIVYIIATEKDTHGFAIFVTLAAALIYYKYIIAFFANWQLSLLCILVYGFIGGLWSIWRWVKYCKKTVDEYTYYPTKGGEGFLLTKEQTLQQILSPKNHKSRLIGWIVYWPWSMIWNVLGDFFTGIYDFLSIIYERVSSAVIRNALAKSTTKNVTEYIKNIPVDKTNFPTDK